MRNSIETLSKVIGRQHPLMPLVVNISVSCYFLDVALRISLLKELKSIRSTEYRSEVTT